MKSNKITSLKKAREIIEQSDILEMYGDDGTEYANYVTWEKDSESIELGKLYIDHKSRRVYIMLDPNPSELRTIAKVFNYEIVCNLYGGFEYRDTSILWLKGAVNGCTS